MVFSYRLFFPYAVLPPFRHELINSLLLAMPSKNLFQRNPYCNYDHQDRLHKHNDYHRHHLFLFLIVPPPTFLIVGDVIMH